VWGEASFHSWFRDGHDYQIFYETMDYNEIVKTISSYGLKGETYIWAAYYDINNPEQLEYSIATYLLGKNGDHVVFQPQPVYDGGYPNNLAGYDISTCIKEYERNNTVFDIELGSPLGEFYTEKVNGVKIWVRKFTKGIVYCNPNEDQ
jgi:hypothetical protein